MRYFRLPSCPFPSESFRPRNSLIGLNRSKLFLDGTLLANDDGLHGMVQRCGQRQLSSGPHVVYIEGFQAGGGVGMEAKYAGPDTGGQMIFMRSGTVAAAVPDRRYYPACDPDTADTESTQFTMCVFRSEVFLPKTPALGQADTGANRLYYVGKGRISVVDLHNLGQFRAVVGNTPDANYAWAIYGNLKVGAPGKYTLCITSDDG